MQSAMAKIDISPGIQSPVLSERPVKDLCTVSNENDIELRVLNETSTSVDIEPRKTRSTIRIIAVLTGLYVCMFITALDQTIVATAVPTITSDLSSASGYVWIGSAYMLANAAAGPIWAKLSDIWGRKPLLLLSVAMFFGSSIMCAMASGMTMLIVGRSLQGTAGGGLVQLVMITISDLFSMRHRSLYFGLMEVVWAVAGGCGPILGGALTEKLSWRWAFWINLPISGVTFVLLLLFLDVHNPKTAVLEGIKAIDWFGSLSILGLTLMLLLGLQFGGATFPWKSPQVLCLVIFGTLMSAVFIFSEKRLAKYPLMPLDIFKKGSNLASLLLTFLHGMVYIAGEYYLPLYFQSALGASPLHSGILILPITVTEALTGIAVGIFIHRTGRYLELIYVGVVLMTIGNGLYVHFSATSPIAQIISFQVIAGIGQGLLFEAPLIAIQAFVSQDDTATATSTFGFTRNLSTALSIVICGVIFQNSMDMQVASLAAPPLNIAAHITEALSGGRAAANVMIIETIADTVQRDAVKDAFVWSLRNMWIFSTCAAGAAGAASLFVKKAVLSREHVETVTGLKKEKEMAAEVAE